MNFLLGTSGPVRPDLPPHLMDEGERAAGLVEKATSDILLQVGWSSVWVESHGGQRVPKQIEI